MLLINCVGLIHSLVFELDYSLIVWEAFDALESLEFPC